MGFVGHRTKVHAVGPQAGLSAGLSTACQNITSCGHTYYDSSPCALAPPWPEANGYTRNHANFPDEYERWANKAASGKASGNLSQKQTRKLAEASGVGPAPAARSAGTENAKQDIAILVFMGVVKPEKSGVVSKIGVCVPLNHDFTLVTQSHIIGLL